MIIGHGDIASVLRDRKGWTFFAAGVSNSQETRESEYKREIELLGKQSLTTHLVYFSSLCIFYSDSRYVRHKMNMEHLVSSWFPTHTIIRMGNITWGSNPYTLINFIRNRIKNREPVEIQDVYRYIVELDEFWHWMNMIPDWSCEMNIIGRRMKVKDIVREYCYPWPKCGEWEIRDVTGECNHSESELSVHL